MPYRTADNAIDGLVLTFAHHNGVREERDFVESIVAAISEPPARAQ